MKVKIMVGNDIAISRKFEDEESAMNAFKKLLIPEMFGIKAKEELQAFRVSVPNYEELEEKKKLLDKLANISSEVIQPKFVQETYRDNSSDAEVIRKKFTIHKCSCGHTLYKKIDPNDSVIYCDSCKREIELDIVPGRYTCPNCGFMSSKNIRIGIEKGLAEPEVIEMNCSVCRGPVDLFYNKEKDNYFSERVV